MIHGWYFGFCRPRRTWRGFMGHVAAWGCDEERSWMFVDPRAIGLQMTVLYRLEDVEDMLAMLMQECDSILWLPQPIGTFRIPVHGPMTCASICGSLVGLRALSPWGLRRKLLANGAEVVHENSERGSSGQSSATA